jgi:hypothetical protein
MGCLCSYLYNNIIEYNIYNDNNVIYGHSIVNKFINIYYNNNIKNKKKLLENKYEEFDFLLCSLNTDYNKNNNYHKRKIILYLVNLKNTELDNKIKKYI